MTKPDLLRDISRENSELAMKGKTKTKGCDHHITRVVNEIVRILIWLHPKILNLVLCYTGIPSQSVHLETCAWS